MSGDSRQLRRQLYGVRAAALIAAAGSALLALGAGCSSGASQARERDSGEPTRIAIGDFRAGDAGEPSAAPAVSGAVSGTTPETMPGDGSSGGPDRAARPPVTGNDLVARSDAPPSQDAARRIVLGDGLDFLDAKVGDINGRPIYVTSFFKPIEARLRALAEREAPQQWQRSMVEIVRNRLDSIIFDELLRAETLASLSPEQRVGLQAFLERFRDDVLSQNLGSAQLANRRLVEEQGVTLDEALRQKELDTLVGLTLHNEINRRVNVSWRDVKNRYERDYERFNPPPTARLRVVRLVDADGAQRDEITASLEGGASFVELAESDINSFNTDTGGVHEVLIEDGYTSTQFFAPQVLNEAIWALEEGEWGGPVELGSSVFWVYLEDMVQESRTLYEAQLTIMREIETERRERERAKYLADLIDRAKVSSRDEILLRLVSVANRLYAPPS